MPVLTGTAVHGVQVVDQGFHGLIGGLVGLLLRVLPDEGNDLVQLILRDDHGMCTAVKRCNLYKVTFRVDQRLL